MKKIIWIGFTALTSLCFSIHACEDRAFEPIAKTDNYSPILNQITKPIHWLIENRGGLSFLTSCYLVPSHHLCPSARKSEKIINEASRSEQFTIERFELPVEECGTILKGVIYYPKDWNPDDRSHCILYNNSNGSTLSYYFMKGDLGWTPGEFFKLIRCPIIMYDYSGTGLSSENQTASIFKFRPTYRSIVKDGITALRFALERFKTTTIIGTSLGGAVATAALAELLKVQNPPDSPYFTRGRVQFISLDSFTATSSVMLPNWPIISSWVYWVLGGYVDAVAPMKIIIDQGIPITVLCHLNDPTIPAGARMADLIETLPHAQNVSVIYSQEAIHAYLTHDMQQRLRRD
jgi:hypothetical protein